jgi:hypothetical protein
LENTIGVHILYGERYGLAFIFKDQVMNDWNHDVIHSAKILPLGSFKYIDEFSEALDAWGTYPAFINTHLSW